MKKKLLALILCAAFIFSYIPSFATSDTSESGKVEETTNTEETENGTDTKTDNNDTDSNNQPSTDADKIERVDETVKESGNVNIIYMIGEEMRYQGSEKTKDPYDTYDVSKFQNIQFDGFEFSHIEKKVDYTGDLTVTLYYKENAEKKYDFSPSMKLRIEVVDESQEDKKIDDAIYPLDINRQSVELDGKEISLDEFWKKAPFIPEGYESTGGFGPDIGFSDGEFIGSALVRPIETTKAKDETKKDEKPVEKNVEKQEVPKDETKDSSTKKTENPVKEFVQKLPRTGVASLRYMIIAAVILIAAGFFFTKRKK